MLILKCNERHWRTIRQDVKRWVLENYGKWKLSQPIWFTEDLIARIPEDFIPKEVAAS